MPSLPSLESFDIVRVIQLAVAPVFLLAGIGALLNVLTHRLARIIDRARHLEARTRLTVHISDDARVSERTTLKRRASLISQSIALCTLSLLLVCLVVTVLFVGVLFDMRFSAVIAVLFVVSMLSLIVALTLFLREIFLGTTNLRGPL